MDKDLTEALKKTFGKNLRKARTRQGLTQEQMAELVEMSTEVFGRMERGGVLPRVERLVLICKALGEPADRLLGLSQVGDAPAVAEPFPGYDEMLAVTRRFMQVAPRMTQRQRKELLRSITQLQRFIATFLEQEPALKPRRKRKPRTNGLK